MSSQAHHRTSSHDVDVALDDREPTVRTPTIDAEVDGLPDQAACYEAPRRLPAVSEHKTLDMVPVRLAPDVDPRRAPTQRLSSPSLAEPRRFWLLAGVLTGAVLVVAASLAWMSRRDRAVAPRSAEPVATVNVASEVELLEPAPLELPPSLPVASASAAVSPKRVKVSKPKASAAPSVSASTAPQEAERKERVWLE